MGGARSGGFFGRSCVRLNKSNQGAVPGDMNTSVELAKAALEKYQAKLAELEARQSPQPGELASTHRILAEYQQILLLKSVVADFATLVGAEQPAR